jgi:tetratricopeptide (TPR) repeat protein
MIEYLERLVEERQYPEALKYAEQMLLAGDLSMRDLMVINYVLMIGRSETSQYHAALIPGQLTLRLARELEEWDYHGLACMDLSHVFSTIRQYDQACELCYEFLSHLHLYNRTSKFEFSIWDNLGIIQGRLGNAVEAVKSLKRALEVATTIEKLAYTFGTRHALIGAHLSGKDHQQIPGLLAKCLLLMRNKPELTTLTGRLWHFVLRAEFGLATGRFDRAEKVTRHGMAMAQREQRHMYSFQMLLARIAHARGDLSEALGFALGARVYAIRCQRYDLEFEASELMYKFASNKPEVLNEIRPESVFISLEEHEGSSRYLM